jgi:hypothetical protein
MMSFETIPQVIMSQAESEFAISPSIADPTDPVAEGAPHSSLDSRGSVRQKLAEGPQSMREGVGRDYY